MGVDATHFGPTQLQPRPGRDLPLPRLRRISTNPKLPRTSVRGSFQTVKRLLFRSGNVGAIIDRPPKNKVFRIFRRKITRFSPCGDRFCFSKICGRSMIAPTTTFSTHSNCPELRIGAVFLELRFKKLLRVPPLSS